ncbi:MAG: hybrid sensor histidine kinase/response regulator [Sedimentisphaerales bacterium]|nr:hybrid sensor histidine kinase/response regulator [Sedimentisphaerales bacterium]
MMIRPRSKILAVDDDAVDIKTIEKLLGEHYEFRTATTGEEALVVAADFRPDIILLDNMMPGLDGGQVCRQIRADSGLRHTKIIMLSGKSMVSERIEAYRAGADDYITKPFNEDELLAKIRVYLRLKSVEEVDQFKTDVLTLLCHEARTPLNSLIAPAEILMSEDEINADEKKLLIEMLHSAAKRMHRFFENVMLLSSLKSGKWKFNSEPADLCQVVHESVCDVATMAVERKIKIKEKFDAGPTVCLDSQQIKRVITAILDNAIRFSQSGGSVDVCVSGDSESVCVSVTDHGQGIEPDYLPYVFEELSDPDIDHHSKGQGLGLAIARQIVQQHNGTINAESTKSSGTTFTVRLPVMVPSELVHCGK